MIHYIQNRSGSILSVITLLKHIPPIDQNPTGSQGITSTVKKVTTLRIRSNRKPVGFKELNSYTFLIY
jgi:hypothetical protein